MKNQSDLFERYLQAVRKYLPWKGQDDILNELRANLEAQLEEREEEQARPLSSEEMAAWLKGLGSPIQMAARYQPQQYLIGPTLFPMYWWVLRIAFVWATVIYALVETVLTFTNGPAALSVVEALVHYPGVLVNVAVWVTLIFAALEFAASRYPSVLPPNFPMASQWTPASLPPLEKAYPGGKPPQSYAKAVAEVVFGYIVLVWLLLVPHHPYLLLGPGAFYLSASPFRLAAVWTSFYWLVLALNVVQVAWNGFRLWRGSWQDRDIAHNLSVKVLGLLPIVSLLMARDHVYLALKRPETDMAHYGQVLDSANLGIWRGLQVLAAIVVLQLMWEIGKAATAAYRDRVVIR